MAKKSKKSKISIASIAVAALAVVCLVLAIVGVCIDEWTTTEEVFGAKASVSFSDYSETASKLQDAKDTASDWGFEIEDDSKLTPMVAFGYIAVIAAAAVAALAILNLLLKGKIFSLLTGIIGIAALAVGVISIALTASFCGDYLVVGTGAILTAVGAMGAGLAGASKFVLK